MHFLIDEVLRRIWETKKNHIIIKPREQREMVPGMYLQFRVKKNKECP